MADLELLVGSLLHERFRLDERISTTGMSVVYRASDLNTDQLVAVKILRSNVYYDRFRAEARLSYTINHPNIAAVIDYVIDIDKPEILSNGARVLYLVMKWVPGETLKSLITSNDALNPKDEQKHEIGPLQPSTPLMIDLALKIVKPIASALDYLYQDRHMVHRDIKPGNIMYDPQRGQPCLIDLGIAKQFRRLDDDETGVQTNFTEINMIVGTDRYMPPEQTLGIEGTLTSAVDQYALAVTIYELLSNGHSPFDTIRTGGGATRSTTNNTMQRQEWQRLHREADPTSLLRYRADFPEQGWLVLQKALSKSSENRYPTVMAFANAFEAAISPRLPEPASLSTRKPRPAINPIYLIGGIIVALVVIVILIVAVLSQPNTVPTPTQAAVQNTSLPPTSAEILTNSSTASTVESLILVPSLTFTDTFSPTPTDTSTGTSIPTSVPPATISQTELFQTALAENLTRAVVPTEAALTAQAMLAQNAINTPTPTDTATMTASSTDTATASPTFTATASSTFTAIVSPTFTMTASPTYTATDLPTFTPTPTPTASLTFTLTATASPSFTPTNTPTRTASPTLTSTPTSTVNTLETLESILARHATQTAVAFTPPPTATFTPSPTATALGGGYGQLLLYLSPDGRKDHDIYTLDLRSGNLTHLIDDPNAEDVDPVWSPDHSRIVFASNRNAAGDLSATDSNLYLMDIKGGGITQLTFQSGGAGRPRWSPDGKRIAYYSQVDKSVQIFVVDLSGNFSQLTFEGDNRRPSWTPGGSQIVFFSKRDCQVGPCTSQNNNYEIYVMDSDGKNQRPLTDDNFLNARPIVSPDGSWIAWHREIPSTTSANNKPEGDIYLMRPNGTDPQAFAAVVNENEDSPVWSPDANWIAFTRNYTGSDTTADHPRDGLYIRNRTTNEEQFIINFLSNLSVSDWS